MLFLMKLFGSNNNIRENKIIYMKQNESNVFKGVARLTRFQACLHIL